MNHIEIQRLPVHFDNPRNLTRVYAPIYKGRVLENFEEKDRLCGSIKSAKGVLARHLGVKADTLQYVPIRGDN